MELAQGLVPESTGRDAGSDLALRDNEQEAARTVAVAVAMIAFQAIVQAPTKRSKPRLN